MSSSIKDDGEAFVNFYYQAFDSYMEQLTSVYKPESLFTYLGEQMKGPDEIIERLDNHDSRFVHKAITVDVQPNVANNSSFFVFVSGALYVDDEQQPRPFSQFFQLAPNGNGSHWIQNSVFRLGYFE